MIVLLEDECHLVWGDVCGMAWGQRNVPMVVPMTNERQRQTYYGALNLLTQEFHLYEASAGNGVNTVAYLQWCQTLYPDKLLGLRWDGASYHRGEELQKFLAEDERRLGRSRLESHLSAFRAKCAGAESDGRCVAQRPNTFTQAVCAA